MRYIKKRTVKKYTFDERIFLLKEKITIDELLQEKIEYEEIELLAEKKSISRNEYYKAKELSLQLSYIFVINSFEYNSEKLLKYNDKKYNILKTYDLGNDLLELTCEEVLIIG